MERSQSTTGALSKTDWQSIIQGFEETNPSDRSKSLQSTVEYLAREGKLEYCVDSLTEFLTIAKQHQSSSSRG